MMFLFVRKRIIRLIFDDFKVIFERRMLVFEYSVEVL